MTITPNIQYVDGSFDTKTTEMVCVAKQKYLTVDLCMKSDNGWNVPIAHLQLSSSDLCKDIEPVFEDMYKLGEEIARRWNECENKI